MKYLLSVIFLVVASLTSVGQNVPTQCIRGHVVEQGSREPLPFTAVKVLELPQTGALADLDGSFVIEDVPVGRYTLVCTMPGFSTTVLKEQML